MDNGTRYYRDNIYCDIKVYNNTYKMEAYHRRVPKSHVDWLRIAPHLYVKILKKYKIDNGYYKNKYRGDKNNERKRETKKD